MAAETVPDRPAFARLVPVGVAFVVVLVAGCSSPDTATFDDRVRSDLRRLHADGLLIAPEIWNVVGYSALSEAIYVASHRVLGDEVVVTDRETLTRRLVGSEAPADAAYWGRLAGLEVPYEPSTEEVDDALDGATSLEGLATLHRLIELEVPIEEHEVSTEVLDELRLLVSSSQPHPAMLASEILASLGHEHDVGERSAGWILEERSPHDEELLFADLHAWVVLHGSRGLDRLDHWVAACGEPKASDVDIHRCVAAFDGLGRADLARQVLEEHVEADRLHAGRGVLEDRPLFEPSIGSTERVLRFVRSLGPLAQGRGLLRGTDLDVERVRSSLDVDLSHEVHGLAILTYLDAVDEPAARLRAAFDEVLREEVAVTGDLGIDELLAWTALAELAMAVDLTIDPRSASVAAVAEMGGAGEEGAYAAARYLRAWAGQGGQASSVDLLLDVLHRQLEARPLRAQPTLLALAGHLALVENERSSPFDQEDLEQEIERRRGGCIGGFEIFIREERSSDAACNVDATRLAQEVMGR